MKRAAESELGKPGGVSSDDSSDSDSDDNVTAKGNKFGLPNPAKGSRSEGILIRKAEMYQAYMRHIPIPSAHGSLVLFTSWQGLADSLKALYHQPLHYLTNLQLRQWDRLRQGSLDDNKGVRLDDLIHPVKAEALVWLMEETHRKNFVNVAAMSRQKKLAFDALSRHGYRGGPSVLKVPPPKEPEKEPDWSWSTGKDRKTENKNGDKDGSAEESYEERERTRAALAQGEKLLHVANKKEREKEKSFSQKEKRKRDLGQASRGKNYVEEEKRLLRDNGVYSGFD